jgi:hypothetical protein
MDMLAFAGITAATQQLTAAAAAGFTFSGPGAEVLLRAVEKMQEDVFTALQSAYQFKQEPALGQTPAAQVYKPFMASIASDSVQGFVPLLGRLQKDLADVHASLKQSVPAYVDGDEAVKSKYTTGGMLA